MRTFLSVRLAVVVPREEADAIDAVDLGRIRHEVTPAELWSRVEQLDDTDDDYLVQAWEEDAVRRVLRDERSVSREIADALVEGKLDELVEENLLGSLA